MVGFEGKNEVKGRFYASVCVFCVSELVAKLEGCDWLSIIWKEKGKLMRKERKKSVLVCSEWDNQRETLGSK
jgi:hypothetical protein